MEGSTCNNLAYDKMSSQVTEAKMEFLINGGWVAKCHLESDKINLYLIPYIKIIFKWIVFIKVKIENHRCTRRKHKFLFNFTLGKGF